MKGFIKSKFSDVTMWLFYMAAFLLNAGLPNVGDQSLRVAGVVVFVLIGITMFVYFYVTSTIVLGLIASLGFAGLGGAASWFLGVNLIALAIGVVGILYSVFFIAETKKYKYSDDEDDDDDDE